MPKPRGRSHTTLTETAALVVQALKRIPHIKMIAPGEIRTTRKKSTGKRFITVVFTNAGLELIVTGQSVQKIAVHTNENPQLILQALHEAKPLKDITFQNRERKPGV